MKKSLSVLVVGILFSLNVNAQWIDFSNNRDRLGIGLNLGVPGTNTTYQAFGWGVSLDVWGFYLDFVTAGPEHKFDNHVNSTKWQDSTAFTLSVGYQIPVLPWLRIMPLAGFCQTTYGLTDAETVNIETNENTSSMYHDYNVTPGSRKYYFNYGAGLVVTPIKWFNIYGVYSRNAIYGGLSINLGSFKDEEE